MATTANEMTALEIARKLMEFGQTQDACRAYEIVMSDKAGTAPAERLEGAIITLQFGNDYKVPYNCFLDLYRQGEHREDILPILTDAFFSPNEGEMKKKYERNCKLLSKYPYCFRKDLLPYDELPVRFFPYDDKGYVPFYINEDRFGEYIAPSHPVISRNFFHDLDAPILATDVFSQYELEYLHDNVRKSEWVAKDNHIYLHYTSWPVFCAYLQCVDLRDLLKEEKFVFLMEDEISRYPIDFKHEFGIDYSQFPIKPIGIREIHRLIWHTQLSIHNGGDFFNEVLFGHPNLLTLDSLMFDNILTLIADAKEKAKQAKKAPPSLSVQDKGILLLSQLKNVTDKDALIAAYFSIMGEKCQLDAASRIAPALLIQPHFRNIIYSLDAHSNGGMMLTSEEYDQITTAPFMTGFKYIKTFTPMRRMTTSYSGGIRFTLNQKERELRQREITDWKNKPVGMQDTLSQRVLNHSYLVDPEERLFMDSVLVRFEDGKLNPKATFTALAAFLDIPYTDSMTYCSGFGGINPSSVKGFDPVTVYRTYDEYANFSERYFLEYLQRQAYRHYGYDFHYYDGAPVDNDRLANLIKDFSFINGYMTGMRNPDGSNPMDQMQITPEERKSYEADAKEKIEDSNAVRLMIGRILNSDPVFVNKNGIPLAMMPLLDPLPELMEQPLYH